jgi:hypothetical protein
MSLRLHSKLKASLSHTISKKKIERHLSRLQFLYHILSCHLGTKNVSTFKALIIPVVDKCVELFRSSVWQ